MSKTNAHTQYHDTLDKIELGLEAFEKLLAFTRGMSKVIDNYDVFDDVNESYEEEGSQKVKDFIKLGLDFVRSQPDADQLDFNFNFKAVAATGSAVNCAMSQVDSLNTTAKHRESAPQTDEADPVVDCPTEPGGQPVRLVDSKQTDKYKEQEAIFHLSQVDQQDSLDFFQPTQVYNTNKTPVEAEKEGNQLVKSKKKKQNCNKDKRQRRLLKFQERLVRTHGLPPSRLMVGKNLGSEFEQIARAEAEPVSSTEPSSPTSALVLPVLMPGQPGVQPLQTPDHDAGYHAPPAPVPPDRYQVPMPGYSQSLGQVAGISSGSNHNFTLSSSPSPQYILGSTSGPVGWSEARPVIGNRWEDMTLLPSGLPFGSTSGYPNLLALSPSPQSSIGFVSSYQTPPQPHSPSRSPAYCFHCMQYGAVFTINQV